MTGIFICCKCGTELKVEECTTCEGHGYIEQLECRFFP